MGLKEGTIRKNGQPARRPGRAAGPQKPKVYSDWDRNKPRPHVWRSGPDEERHKMYQPWLLSKAQANFRNEGFDLTFDQYYTLWRDHWDNRGRRPENVCMTRLDPDLGWTQNNVIIITRKEHFQRQGQMRHQYPGKYKTPGRKPRAQSL